MIISRRWKIPPVARISDPEARTEIAKRGHCLG